MRKLLIADDEPGVRTLVRMTLLNETYEIIEAGDGIEALSRARAELPSMILLDIMMPGMSGFDVCHALRRDERTRGITVVLLTAQAQTYDREQGASVGADDYFTKPFSPVALLRKVDEVFASV